MLIRCCRSLQAFICFWRVSSDGECGESRRCRSCIGGVVFSNGYVFSFDIHLVEWSWSRRKSFCCGFYVNICPWFIRSATIPATYACKWPIRDCTLPRTEIFIFVWLISCVFPMKFGKDVHSDWATWYFRHSCNTSRIRGSRRTDVDNPATYSGKSPLLDCTLFEINSLSFLVSYSIVFHWNWEKTYSLTMRPRTSVTLAARRGRRRVESLEVFMELYRLASYYFQRMLSPDAVVL